MANKMADLQNALKSSSGRMSVAESTPPVKTEVVMRSTTTQGSRAGKENIAAWLPVGFKKSIRLLQAKLPGDPPVQDLMAEALNDLFTKYNLPTVSE